MAVRFRSEPPPQMYADEPVIFKTGAHWMSQDIIFGLAALLVAYVVVTLAIQPDLTRYAIIPAVPLLIKLGTDLPRFWRFETVLTPRRLIVNVGTARDVFHTLWVRDMLAASASQGRLGRLFGYGDVSIAIETTDITGKKHRGAYTVAFVRDPNGLARAIRDAMEQIAIP